MADKAINDNDVDIPSVNFAQQGSDVAAPAAGRWQLYFKAGGLYARNNAGTVVGPFSTSPGMAADPLWDAAGDIAVGTGPDAAARLAVGTAYQQLRVNSDATGLEYVSGGLVRVPDGRVVVGGGGAATVTLPSTGTIPAIYESLLVLYQIRGDNNSGNVNLVLQFNGDTGANYDDLIRWISQGGNNQFGAAGAVSGRAGIFQAASSPANYASIGSILIPSYARTVFYKSWLGAAGYLASQAATGTQELGAVGWWRSTAAITSIRLAPNLGNFAAGSTFTLYGVM